MNSTQSGLKKKKSNSHKKMNFSRKFGNFSLVFLKMAFLICGKYKVTFSIVANLDGILKKWHYILV